MTIYNELKNWQIAALPKFVPEVSWAVTMGQLKPLVNLGPDEQRVFGKLSAKSPLVCVWLWIPVGEFVATTGSTRNGDQY